MMHHPNMHHQTISGHPGPQHIQSHQGVPTHHQLPHQMHRDQARLGMSQTLQPSSLSMGQPPMGGMQGPIVHHSQQGPPTHQPPMRHHRPPPIQHSQHMTPMRRPFICGTTQPLLQQRPPQPTQMHHNLRPIQQTTLTSIMHQQQIVPQSHPQLQPKIPDKRLSPVSITVDTPTSNSIPSIQPAGSVNSIIEENENNALTNGDRSEILDDKPDSPVSDETISAGVANSKEKTPMCLVNELARSNKIKHQYRLTRETGPAHKKSFTVALRLGEGENGEEYVADGSSIKRAQHAAAAEALRRTRLSRPPPKPPVRRRNDRNGLPLSHRPGTQGSIMPTVELNALAMKLCQPAIYHTEPPIPLGNRQLAYRGPPPPPAPHFRPQGFPFRGFWPAYRVRGAAEVAPALLYRVRLVVGTREWSGEGPSSQAARHAAAASALRDLRDSMPPNSPASEAIAPVVSESPTSAASDDDELENAELKSPVSLVHEMALKRNLSVTFKVKNERGPPHMKVFVTTCTVGELETEGEGNGKRVSKRRAAEAMVALMKSSLVPLPQQRKNSMKVVAQRNVKRKPLQPKKRARNLIKEGVEGNGPTNAMGASGDTAPNPISVLAVRQASQRARSPQYRLVEERGAARRRCFIVECAAPGGATATGQGPNKKAAKRNAAENVLIAMGVNINKSDSSQTSPLPKDTNDSSEIQSITNIDTKQSETNKSGRKVTFSVDTNHTASNHSEVGGACGRQLVPGLLLMQDHHNSSFNSSSKVGVNAQATATIAKELLRACTSPTSDMLTKQSSGHARLSSSPVANPISSPMVSSTTMLGGTPTQPPILSNVTSTSSMSSQHIIRPKDQLLYLAQLLGFQVEFSDFPKGNHGEYLSLVSLSTEPPVMCHGGGATTERSHDQSARAALECLSRMGLDNVAPGSATCPPDGDGLRIGASGVTKPSLLSNGLNK